jgi:outer membrane protein assembly factor BamB
VAGVAADDGRLLWQYAGWQVAPAAIASPIPLGDGRILLAGGYGSGAQLIRLTGPPDAIRVERVYKLAAGVFGAEQQTPILYGGYVYGVVPPAGNSRLVCLDPADGRVLWATQPSPAFGLGCYVLAAGTLMVLEEDTGVMQLYKADPAACVTFGGAAVIGGQEIWAPPALAAGRLLIRNQRELICLDVS